VRHIRVAIGSEPRTEVAAQVLEYSIRKHAAAGATVEIHRLDGAGPAGRAALGGRTGFSLQRWTIPERFGFEGKSIYLDSDQLCLADLGELWDAERAHPGEGCLWCTRVRVWRGVRGVPFLRVPRRYWETSVMLVDCAKARGRLWGMAEIERVLAARPNAATYDAVMHVTYLRPPPQAISPWWNVMDGRRGGRVDFEDPRAKILHFTRVRTQPWFDPAHAARPLWERYLAEAIDAGAVDRATIARACAHADGMHPYWQRYAR
jgi:hypothetical protein